MGRKLRQIILAWPLSDRNHFIRFIHSKSRYPKRQSPRINGLRNASMTKLIRCSTNNPQCFLRNMTSVRDRIALGRMDIECAIRTCKKLKAVWGLRGERTDIDPVRSFLRSEVEKCLGRAWGRIVRERSDLNDKILCDEIILAQVRLFQAMLSELWRKSSGVCENYLTEFNQFWKHCFSATFGDFSQRRDDGPRNSFHPFHTNLLEQSPHQ
jgi:hypothetical protein